MLRYPSEDSNVRLVVTKSTLEGHALLNKLIAYFDLLAGSRGQPRLQGREVSARGSGQDAGGGPPPEPSLSVLPQYVALVLGILIQPYFEKYRASGSWAFSTDSALGWLLFAIIAGVIVFPSVYRRAFDPGQPLFVQFCVIFAGGMGWKALLDTALKVGQVATQSA